MRIYLSFCQIPMLLTFKSTLFSILVVICVLVSPAYADISFTLTTNNSKPAPGDMIIFESNIPASSADTILTNNSDITIDQTGDQPPYIWTIQIPNEAAGTMTFRALAVTNSVRGISNPVTITVMPDQSKLEEVFFWPGHPMWLTAGKTYKLRVKGDYVDGVERVLTSGATGTVYSENIVDGLTVTRGDSPVISVSSDGLLAALAPGVAEVIAENNGKYAALRIFVQEAVSLDKTPPSSTITPPTNDGFVLGTNTISGAAADEGGTVVKVEIGITPSDGTTTWYPSTGTTNWSYIWALPTDGIYTLQSRATDDAGNVETPGIGVTVGVDNTPPMIDFNKTCPATTLLNGTTTLNVAVTDNLSGVASQSLPNGLFPLNTTMVGPKTVTLIATDKAGNSASLNCTYQVDYDFSGGGGFRVPIVGPPAVNTIKAGSTIPVKWQLPDGNGSFISNLSAVKTLQFQQSNCQGLSALENAVTTESSGSTGLHYDTSENIFIYNWKTDKSMVGKCYTLNLNLNDGNSYKANFTLK